MKYAIIGDNTVINVIAWDGDPETWSPPDTFTSVLVPDGAVVHIGYIYDGTIFYPPRTSVAKVTTEDLLAEINGNPTSRDYDRSDYGDPESPSFDVYAYYDGVLNELNRVDGGISIDIVPALVARSSFVLRVVAPAAFAIAALEDEATQKKWDRIIGLIVSEAFIDVASPQVQGMMAVGVSDGIITPEQIADITPPSTRTGSRAEELWGEGVGVTFNDLVDAGL